MALTMAEQLVSVGFAVLVGVGAGALLWDPRALAAGDGGDVPVLDEHLDEPWPERVLRGVALVAVAFAAALIYVAAAV